MNVLVIGSGGREHALAWKTRQSPRLGRLYCAPGNPGIGEIAECSPIAANDAQGLLTFAREHEVDLTIVGPEQPLAAGLVDLFTQHGMKVFGPTRKAAQLEWSKAFAKDFMQHHGIPTAAYRTFSAEEHIPAVQYLQAVQYPVVIKDDGLAAGKGVTICADPASAVASLDHLMRQGKEADEAGSVVIEEYLQGEEASVFAICDGVHYCTLVPAQDHKRVFDGDHGRNTGGMGAYAPAPVVTPEVMDSVKRSIIEPTLRGMAAAGRPYKGCLYVGLMITSEGPKVVEYNSRFGDPEAQVILPLYRGDLLELINAACEGKLDVVSMPTISQGSAVCVVLASGGYPDSYEIGKPIRGLDQAAALDGIVVFHAGTKIDRGSVVTAGGRVLGLTAVTNTDDLGETIRLAYDGVRHISFEGMHYRRDIGAKAFARLPSTHSGI